MKCSSKGPNSWMTSLCASVSGSLSLRGLLVVSRGKLRNNVREGCLVKSVSLPPEDLLQCCWPRPARPLRGGLARSPGGSGGQGRLPGWALGQCLLIVVVILLLCKHEASILVVVVTHYSAMVARL